MNNLFTSTFFFLTVTVSVQNTKIDNSQIYDCDAKIHNACIGAFTSISPKILQINPYNFVDNQDTLPHTITFETLLASNNMTFGIPERYIEVKPIENRQMNYEKAYKHPTERFEVRYAIRNADFKYTKQIFEMTVLNISGGLLPNYTTFNIGAAKDEFGADAGATVMVKVGKEFGQDYKYCLLVYIHKNGVGDGYIFYLADNQKTLINLMTPIFHTLKFKN